MNIDKWPVVVAQEHVERARELILHRSVEAGCVHEVVFATPAEIRFIEPALIIAGIPNVLKPPTISVPSKEKARYGDFV